MKSGTARTLKTLVYLAIVGAGAYWAYGNILPLIKNELQKNLIPGPNGPTFVPDNTHHTTSPTQGTSTGTNAITDLGGLAGDIGKGLNAFGDFVWATAQGLSATGTTAAAIDGDVESEADFRKGLAAAYGAASNAAAAAEAARAYAASKKTGHAYVDVVF